MYVCLCVCVCVDSDSSDPRAINILSPRGNRSPLTPRQLFICQPLISLLLLYESNACTLPALCDLIFHSSSEPTPCPVNIENRKRKGQTLFISRPRLHPIGSLIVAKSDDRFQRMNEERQHGTFACPHLLHRISASRANPPSPPVRDVCVVQWCVAYT